MRNTKITANASKEIPSTEKNTICSKTDDVSEKIPGKVIYRTWYSQTKEIKDYCDPYSNTTVEYYCDLSRPAKKEFYCSNGCNEDNTGCAPDIIYPDSEDSFEDYLSSVGLGDIIIEDDKKFTLVKLESIDEEPIQDCRIFSITNDFFRTQYPEIEKEDLPIYSESESEEAGTCFKSINTIDSSQEPLTDFINEKLDFAQKISERYCTTNIRKAKIIVSVCSPQKINLEDKNSFEKSRLIGADTGMGAMFKVSIKF